MAHPSQDMFAPLKFGLFHENEQVRVVTRSFHPAWGDGSTCFVSAAALSQDACIISKSALEMRPLSEIRTSVSLISGTIFQEDSEGQTPMLALGTDHRLSLAQNPILLAGQVAILFASSNRDVDSEGVE